MNAYRFVKSLRSAVAWGMGPLNKVLLIVRLLKNFKCLIVSCKDLHVKQELRCQRSSSGHLDVSWILVHQARVWIKRHQRLTGILPLNSAPSNILQRPPARNWTSLRPNPLRNVTKTFSSNIPKTHLVCKIFNPTCHHFCQFYSPKFRHHRLKVCHGCCPVSFPCSSNSTYKVHTTELVLD